ncbi:HAD hydrolase-like protein [Thalassospiraceae bacterium LMO-SO8]|nr:HAD hydrolase-like protein [Alphaproteobacteria bacterium LMO-S08]WND76636.1 HAD hydrolase-like protein [Thalassospiraceae bacterium LMO-SO8]
MTAGTAAAADVDPRNIDAVFFDFDGVLVESNEVKIDAFRRLYEPFGSDVVEKVIAEHIRHEGVSRVVKLERFHREFLGIALDDDGLAELAQTYSNMVEDVVVACDAVPGAVEALDTWAGHCPLYVVSGTPQDELRRIAQRRGVEGYFQAVFGSPRVKPDIVGDELARIGVAADRVLFVGDSLTDYDCAVAVGTRFLGRVPAWRESRFPDGTEVAEDMWPLALAGGAAARPKAEAGA